MDMWVNARALAAFHQRNREVPPPRRPTATDARNVGSPNKKRVKCESAIRALSRAATRLLGGVVQAVMGRRRRRGGVARTVVGHHPRGENVHRKDIKARDDPDRSAG